MYHVTFRRNERRAIFRDDADRNRLLKELEAGVEDYEVRLYLWCLMSNHVHLLVETPRANISSFMGGVLTGYSVYFNRRHRRHGHLTQGRFHSPLVEGDRYLLKLSRYIHLNPVCVGAWKSRSVRERRDYLRRYRWSSYSAYRFARHAAAAPAWLDWETVLREHSKDLRNSRRAYRRFVESGIENPPASPVNLAVNGLFLGRTSWVDQMRKRLADEPEDANVPQRKRLAWRPTQTDNRSCGAGPLRCRLRGYEADPSSRERRPNCGRLFDSSVDERKGNQIGGPVWGCQRSGDLQIVASRRVTASGGYALERIA